MTCAAVQLGGKKELQRLPSSQTPISGFVIVCEVFAWEGNGSPSRLQAKVCDGEEFRTYTGPLASLERMTRASLRRLVEEGDDAMFPNRGKALHVHAGVKDMPVISVRADDILTQLTVFHFSNRSNGIMSLSTVERLDRWKRLQITRTGTKEPR